MFIWALVGPHYDSYITLQYHVYIHFMCVFASCTYSRHVCIHVMYVLTSYMYPCRSSHVTPIVTIQWSTSHSALRRITSQASHHTQTTRWWCTLLTQRDVVCSQMIYTFTQMKTVRCFKLYSQQPWYKDMCQYKTSCYV